MRLSFINYGFVHGGGMERYMMDIVAGCVAAGDEVTVAAEKVDMELARKLGAQTHVVPVPRFLPSFIKHRLFFSRASDWAREQVAAGVPTLTLARVSGASLAVCGGTHQGQIEWRSKSAGMKDRSTLKRERATYDSARIVVAHSKLMQDELIRWYGLPEEKVSLVYPPVDIVRFNADLKLRRDELRGKFGLDQRCQLLFPSRAHNRKGLDIVIKAVALLPRDKYSIVIAGRRPPPWVPDYVRYAGMVKNMEELYAACDATVMPSRYEPFGLVYVESLLCGTPVVMTAGTGAAEILPDAAIRLSDCTPEALAAAIVQATTDKKKIDLSFVGRYGLDVNTHVQTLRGLLAKSVTPPLV